MNETARQRAELLAQWMARVAQGDRRAFGRLYSETSPQLFALILRMVRQEAQAEEILQEVYTRVWQRAASYDPDKARVTTWLATIARNLAVDALRGPRGAARVDLDLTGLADTSADNPMDAAQRAGAAKELSLCLEELAPEQKRCILLAYYEGLTHSELALKMESPLGTVKSWVRRGLMRLKDCLNRERHNASV